MDARIKDRIQADVTNNPVMLYMKGTPQAPQCGFSAQAVSILSGYNVDFASFDVLSDDGIRAGIKEFADWPTIPQLYIKGEFVGGCDIITEMHTNGDLAKSLEAL